MKAPKAVKPVKGYLRPAHSTTSRAKTKPVGGRRKPVPTTTFNIEGPL